MNFEKKDIKVGILSLVYQNYNFGGMLQGYALNYILNKYCNANQIRISRSSLNLKTKRGLVMSVLKSNKLFADISDAIKSINDSRDLKNFKHFQDELIDFSGYYNSKSIVKANSKYDCFVVGSDQVWNTEKFSLDVIRMFGLLFASINKKKIAYAASIGAERTISKHCELFTRIMDNIDYISVREQAAKEALSKYTTKEIKVVLDPTLLLMKDEWLNVTNMPELNEPYVFSYFLRETNNRHDEQLKSILRNCGNYKNICIADEDKKYIGHNGFQVKNAGPQEFLGYIFKADYIFTNSFHGMVLSILFHKNFWVFKRNKDSDKKSMNNRIYDFLKMLGLEERIIEDGVIKSKEELQKDIDFSRVDKVLIQKREESLEWLYKAL